VHVICMDIITVVAAPVIHVVMVIVATESLVTHVTAMAKPSVLAILVATVTVAMESLVTHVAAAAKPSVKMTTNKKLNHVLNCLDT
jgi:hypothetical protein